MSHFSRLTILLFGLFGTMAPALVGAHDTPSTAAQPSQAAVIKPTIPTGIDANALAAFQTQSFVLPSTEPGDAGYVVAIEEGRLVGTAGQLIYARNIRDAVGTRYHIVRPVVTLREYGSGKPLGVKARLAGTAVLLGGDDPHSLRIESTTMEVLPGDHLLVQHPVANKPLRAGAPLHAIDAHIIDIQEGMYAAGRYQLVNIDRGAADGLLPGDILAISNKTRIVVDEWTRPPVSNHPIVSPQVPYRPHDEYTRHQPAQVTHFGDIAVEPMRDSVTLPHEHIGYILVYATHDRVSQAVILDASREVLVGYPVHTP